MNNRSSTISKIGQRRQIVIPKDVFKKLGLREGDFVEVTHNKGNVVIKPKKLVNPDDVLTPREAKIVRAAERQLRRGEYITLEQLKHELDLQSGKRRRKAT